ncbi:MAG: hypothetical protein LWY06_18640 [Firmicutes bacterium]|nr:hypothetical protein [Bacillota bacterium]
MKKYLMCLMAAFVFLTGIACAAGLKEEKTFDEKSLKALLGDKVVAVDMTKFTDIDCNLFIFARDNKTRKLEWYYINSSTGKIISKGNCSFRAFNDYAVSPDGSKVMVSTRYPSGISGLDVKSGNWSKMYSNPAEGKPGLGILSISPLVFINNTTAFSLMDKWDKEHFVTDSFIALLITGSTSPQELVSFKELKKNALAAAFDKVPGNWKFMIDYIRLFDDKSMAFILKSKYPSQAKFTDYLFTMDENQKLHLIDKNENGRIFPFDYNGNPVRILYSRTNSKTNDICYYINGKKETIFTGKAIAGRIMDNNLTGLAVIDGKSFSICLGASGSKPVKVQSFKEPYSTGFSKTGNKLVLVNQKEIRVFRIVP